MEITSENAILVERIFHASWSIFTASFRGFHTCPGKGPGDEVDEYIATEKPNVILTTKISLIILYIFMDVCEDFQECLQRKSE